MTEIITHLSVYIQFQQIVFELVSFIKCLSFLDNYLENIIPQKCVAMLRATGKASDVAKWHGFKCDQTYPYMCQAKKGGSGFCVLHTYF